MGNAQRPLTDEEQVRLGLITEHDTPDSPHKEHMGGGGSSGQKIRPQVASALEHFISRFPGEDVSRIKERLFEEGAFKDVASEAGIDTLTDDPQVVTDFEEQVVEYLEQKYMDNSEVESEAGQEPRGRGIGEGGGEFTRRTPGGGTRSAGRLRRSFEREITDKAMIVQADALVTVTVVNRMLEKHDTPQSPHREHMGSREGSPEVGMTSSPEKRIAYLRDKPVEEWTDQDDNIAVEMARIPGPGAEEANRLHENYVTGGQGPMFEPEEKQGVGFPTVSSPSMPTPTAGTSLNRAVVRATLDSTEALLALHDTPNYVRNG